MKRTGHCAVCGHEGALNRFGDLRWHKTRRIASNGKPYVSAETCLGAGHPPLALTP